MAKQTSSKKKQAAHRGRIQAQGGGTEKSMAWAQATPFTKDQAEQFLNQLEKLLTVPELAARKQALQQARDYIERAAKAGGVNSPVSKSFPHLTKEDTDIRIDIEVISGIAFVLKPD